MILLTASLHWSCESPLSETEVVDPNSVQPFLQVIKEIDYKGTVYHRYRGDIYDQQMRYVELKDGGISVNSEKMIVVKDIIGTYYLADDQRVPYSLKTKYSFTVTLSDQSQYFATVTTPSVDLYSFSAPADHDRLQNMNLSWKDTDSNATMSLTVTVYFKTDSSSGFSSHSVKITNPKAGSFTLPANELITEKGVPYLAELTLHSEVMGTIDSRFYINRRAYSHQLITKTVNLK